MTAFFSRFRLLIAAISGACTRHSSGVTRLLTFSQIGPVATSTSLVNASGRDPSAISPLLLLLTLSIIRGRKNAVRHAWTPAPPQTFASSEHKSQRHIVSPERPEKGLCVSADHDHAWLRRNISPHFPGRRRVRGGWRTI